MASWLAEIRVDLRPGLADPEGSTVTDALHALGYGSVVGVRFGKLLHVRFSAVDAAEAERLIGDMVNRLLANPVMEVASWDIRSDDREGAP